MSKLPLFTLLIPVVALFTSGCDRPFQEKDGVVQMEAEATKLAGNWILYGDDDEFEYVAGFSGKGCIRFTGNTEVSGPPDSPLSYHFHISTPGVYQVKMRALKAHMETGEEDKANDCFLKLVGGEGWLGEFTKFVLLDDSYGWYWNVVGEPTHHAFEAPEYSLEAGDYELQIAGRSKNFFIDRILLFHTETLNEEEVLKNL